MACDKGFSSSFMLLKPEEVGLLDLFHILFSRNLEEKKFVDCPEGTVTEEISFRRRWLIFVSILAQKFLQLLSKPLSVIGSGIEMCLNLVSVNRNVFMLVINFFRDYQQKATTQAFMLRDKSSDHDTLMVAFRGTEPFDADAWCSDFDISWYELSGVGKIHGGFMKALGLRKNVGWPKETKQEDGHPDLAYYAIRDMLNKLLRQNDQARYILTGHSLGGALAILFPAVLALHNEPWLLERLQGVYTFGQPRVGDEKFGEFMEEKLQEHNVRYYRFVYGNDMVPRLPYDDKALMFKHFGTCLYYNRHYKVKVVEHEPNKNYFSPLGAIPMIINAFFELIRSFTIAKAKGPDYKEGTFLRIFRIIGLVFPGVPAHSTQDYVNATRLGSSDVFLLPKDTSSHEDV